MMIHKVSKEPIQSVNIFFNLQEVLEYIDSEVLLSTMVQAYSDMQVSGCTCTLILSTLYTCSYFSSIKRFLDFGKLFYTFFYHKAFFLDLSNKAKYLCTHRFIPLTL